jgi:hypothetical protein
MIKVFIPTDKKNKTSVRGFWRNDRGITFYDYLRIKEFYLKTDKALYNNLDNLKYTYSQEALFYVKNNKGYCFNDKYNIEELSNRIYTEVLRANLKTEIKEALRVYGGVTIYKEGNKYFKEIFYK